MSLVALWGDYRPAVIGIRGYQYEKNGESYKVLFEPFTFRFGTREIVMFNPRDEHEMTSHDSDLLRRSGDVRDGREADGISDFSASPDRVNYLVPRPPAHSGRTNGSPSLQG
ncbi:MAG TPA: hypothetical protein VFT39_22370 [Vicinamibacterales bacterium]|nr:hypothetical protein [Vicinamibacterales bacterium]